MQQATLSFRRMSCIKVAQAQFNKESKGKVGQQPLRNRFFLSSRKTSDGFQLDSTINTPNFLSSRFHRDVMTFMIYSLLCKLTLAFHNSLIYQLHLIIFFDLNLRVGEPYLRVLSQSTVKSTFCNQKSFMISILRMCLSTIATR